MFEQIRAAGERLCGVANVTPVMTSRTLNRIVGAEVFLKCENYQRIGAFKFRGAYNAISLLTREQAEKGVITFSSGNHGQAVALVGKLMGIRTTVVMPADAPRTKRLATEEYGANVIEYDVTKTTREQIAGDLEAEYGYTMIPPFDHADVIAGQGTAAMELFRELGPLDMLLAPCGGGGLLSGSAISAKHFNPSCRVIGIEPEVADDAARSFNTGQLQTVRNPPTIADGARTPSLGKLTFPLVMKYVDGMETVSEESIKDAVRFLFHRMKMVVEPSGALGISALLSGGAAPKGRVGVIISGGNIDDETMTMILNRGNS